MAPLEPTSIAELSAVLRDANAARRPLVPVGNRTHLKTLPASAASAALLTSTTLRMAIDHVAGDLVATIPAGVTLAAANAALAREGQCLPLDPAFADRATIGGIVSTNESGPRRHRYGAPRDLIIGIGLVLADGRVAKAGGRVVKNVAGYDLSRLMCGSFGSLAVITSATFKLSPVPPDSRTIVAQLSSAARLSDLVQALVNAPLTPSTIEVAAPPIRILVRFETTRTAADDMAWAAAAICATHGASVSVLDDGAERDAWAAAENALWNGAGTVVKLAVVPTDVAYLLDEIQRGCEAHGTAWALLGRAALGVLFVRVDGEPHALASLVADWRHRATVHGGSLVVQSGGDGLERVSRWGDPLPAMPLMRAVKARFDPNGILSPGMGPGGL